MWQTKLKHHVSVTRLLDPVSSLPQTSQCKFVGFTRRVNQMHKHRGYLQGLGKQQALKSCKRLHEVVPARAARRSWKAILAACFVRKGFQKFSQLSCRGTPELSVAQSQITERHLLP